MKNIQDKDKKLFVCFWVVQAKGGRNGRLFLFGVKKMIHYVTPMLQ